MPSMTTAAGGRRLAFAWLWALAVILHLLYLPGESALLSSYSAWNLAHLALGLGALALLCRPRSTVLLAFVCVLVPVTAWQESPTLGNHWLLASLVALTLLTAILIGTLGPRRDTDDAIDRDGFPTVRVVLLVAYAFAALSKFNSSFADPTVSCANLYLDQVARSIGISGLHASSGDGWTHVVPFVVMAIEASVVVLLAYAPTRVIGVVVAFVFHGIISIDTEHAFSDFTSVIVVLAVLFLPDAWFDALAARVAAGRTRLVAIAATTLVATASGVLLLWQSLDRSHHSSRTIGHGRDALWWVIGTIVLGLVAAAAVRTRTLRSDVALLPADRWLLAWPGVAVLIGLGPWLGVRTATSWNMYANLVTARGDTNAWFSPGTLQLLGEPGDLVRVVASSDRALEPYVESGDLVPFVNLRLYTATHPDASVTFERDGTTITVPHTRDDPALGRRPEWWWQKILTYRSVDLDGPARCQESMGALR